MPVCALAGFFMYISHTNPHAAPFILYANSYAKMYAKKGYEFVYRIRNL